jgi:precorrin-6B methylase 2
MERRMEMIDLIQNEVTEKIEELIEKGEPRDPLKRLTYRAEKIAAALEGINEKCCQRIRADIQAGACSGDKFKELVREYFPIDPAPAARLDQAGYENLDIFINRITQFGSMAEPSRELEPEMLHYQKTPARIVLEWVEKLQLNKGDVFFDLGSGLGQVVMLVNLLAGIRAVGIEYEPAFCDYALRAAAALHLSGVDFIQADARTADYSGGTIFFMFTPFKGRILQEVLRKLQEESRARKIRIVTYGPCTTEVALQEWLLAEATEGLNIYMPAIFTSL